MKSIIDTLQGRGPNGESVNLYPRTLIECITNKNGDKLEDTLKDFMHEEVMNIDGNVYINPETAENTDEYVPVNADLLEGHKSEYFASKEYVAETVANANHLKRLIVTSIPTVEEAEDNVIYMYKVEDAVGNDLYQEYQLIDDEIVLIGDTSVDLSDIEKIKSGEITVGDSQKLGNETAEQWQEKLDNIQSKVTTVLKQSGWYRVAELNEGFGSTVLFKIGNIYASGGCDEHLLIFSRSYNNGSFSSIYDKSVNKGVQKFSKVRLAEENSNHYLEVFYNEDDYNNECSFAVLSFGDSSCKNDWQTITPTLTEETVEGVTVTCEYDIPSNASPVTDLDLENYALGTDGVANSAKALTAAPVTGSILDYSKTLDVGLHYVNGDNITDVPSGNTGIFEIEVKNKGYYISVTYTPRGDNQKFINTLNYSSWNGWKEFATTDDIADAMESWSYEKAECTDYETLDNYLKNLHNNANDDTVYNMVVNANFTKGTYILGGSHYKIRGYRMNARHGYQIAESITNEILMRYINSDVWHDWKKCVFDFDLTTALAGYLPLSGGVVTQLLTESLSVCKNIAEDITSHISNSVRDIFQRIYANGEYRLHDGTNNKTLIYSSADGNTNTFQGTATGNLPLSGGSLTGPVRYASDDVLSEMPSHYYHKLYNDAIVYEHIYTQGHSKDVQTKKVVRVADGVGGLKEFIINGDGHIAWQNQDLLHTGNYAQYSPPVRNNSGFHNSIFRGDSLGTSVTEAQWAAIKAGTFEDMYIGDYWTINGIVYRIAAFDYYWNSGDTGCTTHHVVIVPDTMMYTAQMNNTETGSYVEGAEANHTVGGYVGSDMYTTNLEQAKTTIKEAFGADHILKHRQLLVNAVTNGYSTGHAWYDSEVELMTEQNVYGCTVFGNFLNGTGHAYKYTIDKTQFPLFAIESKFINPGRYWYWLRDVASSTSFCSVYGYGYCHCNHASFANGVRPSFSIY